MHCPSYHTTPCKVLQTSWPSEFPFAPPLLVNLTHAEELWPEPRPFISATCYLYRAQTAPLILLMGDEWMYVWMFGWMNGCKDGLIDRFPQVNLCWNLCVSFLTSCWLPSLPTLISKKCYLGGFQHQLEQVQWTILSFPSMYSRKRCTCLYATS